MKENNKQDGEVVSGDRGEEARRGRIGGPCEEALGKREVGGEPKEEMRKLSRPVELIKIYKE